MCLDPLSMALASAGAGGGGFAGILGSLGIGSVGTAASVASGAVGAYSAVQQGKAAQRAAEATATAQEAAARQTIAQGEEESTRQRRAGAAQMAAQKVAMAANGVDLGSAAAIETLNDTKLAIEDDAFAIRTNAGNQAKGLAQTAANSRTEGRNARSQAGWGAFNTVLGTAARVGPKFASMARSGAY